MLELLLPWASWHQQAGKNQQKELKLAYQAAASLASDPLEAYPLTQELSCQAAASLASDPLEAYPLTQELSCDARPSVGGVGKLDSS